MVSLSNTSSDQVLDLATAGTPSGVLTRVYGSVGDGRNGIPVAGGFDVDGDGFVDSAFASIQASPLGRTGAGEVTVVFGDGTIGGAINSAGFQPNILKIAGDQNFEVAGAEIWIDDVTGDGIGDILINRQNHTPVAGRPGAGALTIIQGGAELRAAAAELEYLDLRSLPESITATTLVGANAYDRLGIWVRTGDITGDGIADIVVGADEVDAPGESNRGAAYVIRGGEHLATTQTIDLQDFGTTALEGHLAQVNPPDNSTRDHFGATTQIADLDGNGRAEVLVAAALNRAGASIRLPGAPSGTGQAVGGAPRGKLFVAWDDNFSSDLWEAGFTFDIDDSPGAHTIIQGDSFNDAFGEEILGGLDFDGDGNAELFVGDLTADGVNGNNNGVGHIFYHAADLKGRNFSLTNAPDNIQFSLIEGPVAGAIGADTVAQGDFDGDGLGDLVFANPHDQPQGRNSAGSAHIIFGKEGGWPEVINLAVNQLPDSDVVRIFTVQGANGTTSGDVGDTLGYSAAAGDINGDGRTDIIINEMVGNGIAPGSIDVGNLLLISGTAVLVNPASIEVKVTDGSVADGSDDIIFGTALSQYRAGAEDSLLVRPNFGDTRQFLDITNTASSGGGRLRISDIAINAQAIGVSLDLPEGDILINPGETKRVAIDYTPTEARTTF